VIAHNVAATDVGVALACFVHDERGDLVAGLEGFTWGGYAMVEWLWVREDHRGHGLGQRLVRCAEAEAQERGCRVLRVNTHTFQAPHFYSRLGYTVIGSAEDAPVGYAEVSSPSASTRLHPPSATSRRPTTGESPARAWMPTLRGRDVPEGSAANIDGHPSAKVS
jgi:hypothetical protein